MSNEKPLNFNVSKKENIANFDKKKSVEFPYNAELYGRIDKLIHEYSGVMSTAEVIGILAIMNHSLIGGAHEKN